MVLLHELGHAALARAGGYRVTSLGVGLGRPLWHTQLRDGVVLWVAPLLLFGGACTAIPTGPVSGRRAWFHAGGLLAQAVLALALFALPDAWWVDRVAQFNGLVALTNAIPWRIAGSASDGWYLFSLLPGRSLAGDVLPNRAALMRLSAREHAADSRLGALYADTCVAWADLLVGRTAMAGPLFRLDPDATAMDPWVDALFHYVHAEWHRAEGRPLAAVQVARVTRAAIEGEVAALGADLVTLAEARALVDLDADAQARALIGTLAGVGGPVGRQATATLLAASLDAEPDALARATARVVGGRRAAWLDPVDAVHALEAAAERLDAYDRPHAAREARLAAGELTRRVRTAAAPEDRDALARRLATPPAALQRPGQEHHAT